MRAVKPYPWVNPDLCLTDIRRLVVRILLAIDSAEFRQDPKMLVDYVHDAACLAELVNSVDVWIVAGGKLPRDWR